MDSTKIRLTSVEIVKYMEREVDRLTRKYRYQEGYWHITLYKDCLKSMRERIKDKSGFSTNKYYLLAWEIMMAVEVRIFGEIRPNFPHLVIGAFGQGLMDRERNDKCYVKFLEPFDEEWPQWRSANHNVHKR